VEKFSEFMKMDENVQILKEAVGDEKCRIGMTTRPKERRKEWERAYEEKGKKIYDWEILRDGIKDKATAQKIETKLAEECGCKSSPGGNDPDDPDVTWAIYKFKICSSRKFNLKEFKK
jgi:hypothetical protein